MTADKNDVYISQISRATELDYVFLVDKNNKVIFRYNVYKCFNEEEIYRSYDPKVTLMAILQIPRTTYSIIAQKQTEESSKKGPFICYSILLLSFSKSINATVLDENEVIRISENSHSKSIYSEDIIFY